MNFSDVKNSGLLSFYQYEVGNFGFTENELFENMNKILMWLENNADYALIYQYHEDYNGRCWWLTPHEML